MGNKLSKVILLYERFIAVLLKNKDNQYAQKDRYYHKYLGYNSYGIRALKLNKILKDFKIEFKSLNEKEAFELVQKLYFSRVEEQVMVGNYIMTLNIDLITPKKFGWLDKALNYFMSWSTIDDMCIDVLQSVLLRYPKETIVLVKKWSGSQNMWKRRASMVVFTRKVGESGKFTNEVLEICNKLLLDKEDLVQKAIGWALKDNMRGNKDKVMRYIKNLRRKGISSKIILYAIRDLNKKERREILKIKKTDLQHSHILENVRML